MEKHPDGREVAAHLDKGGIATSKQRKILVRIAVSTLVKTCDL